jgi:trehalose 6-phosphate synthase
VARGARESLAARLASGDGAGARGLLDDLARDGRLMGAALCRADGRGLAATATLPPQAACDRLPAHERGEPAEAPLALEDGLAHLSIVPVTEGGEVLGELVLVHDLSFVDRRATLTSRATFLAFALVGLAAAVATILAARFSWRSWTAELRRILAAPFRATGEVATTRSFRPVLADVRDLVSRLAAEEAAESGARWSAERLRHVLRRDLQGEGIIVAANREPYIHQRGPDGRPQVVHPASGLVTALEPVMRACSGTWVAHGGGDADFEVVDARDRVRVPPGDGAYWLRRLRLTPEEERGYYYGFANEGLWPLCHVAHTRPEFRAPDHAQYEAVNRRFAEAVAQEAEVDDPIVLVQDYHFALLPRMVRELLPRATILAFWHVPWPSAERFGICPWERSLLEGLLGASIVGFHTQAHCNNFLESVDRFLEARIDRERSSVIMGGRETLVRPYPISIEWPSRWLADAPPVPDCRAEVRRELGLPRNALLGVGVDRLDYTKGVEERLLSVERLLQRFPALRGRFWFAQLAAPSRTAIPAYQALNERVEQLTARINAQFGGGYEPIVLLRAHHEPPAIFRFYRAADLCYVSSLHDGMNLVAKEFVAARDDLRGVLVLSRFTGAARDLTEALLVNPYDLEAASSALLAALEMKPEEQEERMRSLRAFLAEFNVYRWAGRMLLDATRLRRRDRLALRLGGGPAAGEGRP